MFDDEFRFPLATVTFDEILIEESDVGRALMADQFLAADLQENGFEDIDPPRCSIFDNVDLLCERLVDEFDRSFDCVLMLTFWVAALALLPLRMFRRPLVADLVRSLAVDHSSDPRTSFEADASIPPSARSA